MSPCHVLPYEEADGPANMAMDEALLEWVAADPSAVVVRTYGWLEPTLSLGYFQSRSLADQEERWRGVSLVRRPTGGGALWHDHEVTYAIVLPKTDALAKRATDLYFAVHASIAALLVEHGVAAGRRGGSEAPKIKPFLCFADRDDEDVVVGVSKLVGSAQRRRGGAVLQHGSVLLRRSATTPEFAGAGDLGARETSRLYWSKRLSDAISQAVGCIPVAIGFDEKLRATARQLVRDVYRNPAWLHKR